MSIEDYQCRVLAELAELSERINKLSAFLDDTDKVASLESGLHVNLLLEQLETMRNYQSVLSRRVLLFLGASDV